MKQLLFFGLAVLILASCSPVAQFKASQTTAMAPAKIVFDNQCERAESFVWDFGDGEKSMDISPTHKYYQSGEYQVTLTAKKGNKEETITKTIKIEQPVECLVELETEFGSMIIRLSNATPKHRDNFLKLVEEGYYDDLLFHRVINGFMIQGGDPDSRNAKPNARLGTGGPKYKIDPEFVDSLIHVKGALAAARQGDDVNPWRKSSGSQFYLVQGKPVSDAMLDQIEVRGGFEYTKQQRDLYKELGGTPFLDREYVVFGHVIKGLEVIDEIARQQTTRPTDRPVNDIKMKMRIVE